jgi:hypothetical protein
MPTEQPVLQDLGAARAAAARRGMLFGIPLGELGWFQSLLMGTAVAFAAFFFTTFCAILVCLFLMETGHTLDIAVSYRIYGLSAGLIVLVLAYTYLGFQWTRRKITRG